jgi:formylglycine-generating enzyme
VRTLQTTLLFLVSAMNFAKAESAAPQAINSIGMKFVLIQPGSMQVGVFTPSCPEQPPAGQPPPPSKPPPGITPVPQPTRDRRNEWSDADYATCKAMTARDSSSGFRVEIEKPFYLGQFEVTQAQWQRVMGKNPAKFQGALVEDTSANHPVESITWDDAQAFISGLNRLERTHAYRLPTEFEWEYACRAGGPGQQPWADIRKTAVEGGTSFGLYGGTRLTPEMSGPTTRAVGTKSANAWGLHDMLGNVWEWVQEPHNGKIFPDPRPPASGSVRVLKGGSFTSDVKNAICATHGGGPGNGWDVGLRVVKEAHF